MTSGWADLDKLAVAKPRSDGRATLVVRDARSVDAMLEMRPLSALVAMCRVFRARHVIAEKHAGRGVAIYATTVAPPSFLVDAVSAAGGTVFDGTREHVNRAAASATVQLDAAFCDLAIAVRRRFKVARFADAIEMLERALRSRPPASQDAWWCGVFELAALTGEVLRAERPARWIEAPGNRFPAALDRGKSELVFPGKLAQTILEGGSGSMLALLRAAKAAAEPPAPAPHATAQGFVRPMPLLVDRRSVPIDRLTWRKLVRDEVDTPDMPVIAYVDDRDDVISWPQDRGPPTAPLEDLALANLARQPTELTPVGLPGGRVVVVTGGFFAAEALLDRGVMERVRRELGGPSIMIAGVPARGHLVAADGVRATVDDDFQIAFLTMVEREYLEATERDRISPEVIVYLQEPIGRVQSNLMDARRALRSVGADPDGD